MSKTENFNVLQGLPYQVRARARGKWDETQNKTFASSGESVSLSMTTYNGLNMSYNDTYETAQVLDFSNTVLPWKYEYPSTLTTSKFCLADATNTQYQNIVPLEYTYNFSTVGTLSIDNYYKIVKGFSLTDYVQLSSTFSPSSSPWEMVFKFKPNSLHNGGIINKISSGADYGFRIQLLSDGSMYYLISSSSGNSFLWEGVGSGTYTVGVWNWVKFEWTGTVYNAYLSTDGETWTLDKTYTSSTPLYSYSSATHIGCNPTKGTAFDGEIDLSESYIKINDVDWWVPTFTGSASQTTETMHGCLYGIDDTGSAFTAACFVLNGNGRILLLPDAYKDTDFGNAYSYLGLVNIPAHTVYEYDPSTHEWSEKQALSRNFTVVGTPTIDDTSYEVSDFSESDYITTGSTQFAPSATDIFETNIKFTTGNSVTGSSRTLMETNGILLAIDSGGKPFVSVSDGNDSQTVSLNYTLSPNTTYALLGSIDSGELFAVLTSGSGGTITYETAELTITPPIVASIATFGIAYYYAIAQVGQANTFDGSINMADTIFTVYDEDFEVIFEWAGYE